ncbi:MAG: GDSL family lipase [Leptospira sp.]|nr:GDSL family lipase [Leptospira sp.]
MKKYLFYAIFFFLNLFIFEIVLGLFDPEAILVKSFDKEILFRMYPGRTGKVVSREYSVTVETNGSGFRQKISQGANYDSLVIGDSFTEGWGVEEKEIYVNLLNLFGTNNFRFGNLGLHGSSPALFALQIPFYIKQFKPKKIIVQLFDNDLDDNDKIERFLTLSSGGKVIKPGSRLFASLFGEQLYNFFKELTLYRLAIKTYKFAKKEPSPILYYKPGREPGGQILTHEESISEFGKLSPLSSKINEKYGNQFGFYKDAGEVLWKERFRKNEIYLKQVIEICKANNIALSFLYIPAKEFFAKGGITGDIKNNSLADFNFRNPHYMQIKRICDMEKLRCYFANEMFWGKNPESLYFPYDAHLNPNGHKVLAEELARKLPKL